MSTDWDALYRSGETGWDKGAPTPPLVAELAQRPRHGRVLVPGCGRGHDLRALAEAGATEVVGLDLSPTAVAEASALLADLPQVRVIQGDLFALPEGLRGAFDTVFEHTCFCAIPRARRADYVRAVATALRPDGELLALFYLTPRDDPDPTLGPPFSTSVAELEARFLPYFERVAAVTPTVAFPGREGREALWTLRRRAPLTEAEQVTPSWLTPVLGRPVTAIECEDTGGTWSSQVRLTVTLEDAPEPLALRLKLCPGTTFGPSELEYYWVDYVDLPDAPLLPCFAAAWAHGVGYHLLLADVSATHTNRWELPPDREYGIAVAEALARLHARWWEADPLEPAALERYFAHIEPGLEPLLAATTLVEPTAFRRAYAANAAVLRTRSQSQRGMTRLHGDLNPGNILTPHSGLTPLYLIDRQPFDWSLTVWLAVWDLAYFLAVWWPTEQRAAHESAVLDAWHAALTARVATDYTRVEAEADYRLCVEQCLHVPIEWCTIADDIERMRWVWERQLGSLWVPLP